MDYVPVLPAIAAIAMMLAFCPLLCESLTYETEMKGTPKCKIPSSWHFGATTSKHKKRVDNPQMNYARQTEIQLQEKEATNKKTTMMCLRLRRRK